MKSALCRCKCGSQRGQLEPAAKSVTRDADGARPLSHSSRLPVESYDSIRPSIVGLLDGGRPDAIIWMIRSLVVASFERVSGARSSTHVCKKILIGGPPGADVNSAATVVFVGRYLWVTAAAVHILPAPILGASRIGVPIARRRSPATPARAESSAVPIGEKGLAAKLAVLDHGHVRPPFRLNHAAGRRTPTRQPYTRGSQA